jgi:hypothetical protein
MEEHLIEKGKIDTADPDGGMKVFGEAGGYLVDEPGLDRRQLDKDPSRYE